MAARQFPRDRRQWFRVTCDILEDPKIEKLSGDEFRLFINLLAALARSGSRDGKILLGPRALRSLARKQKTPHAELSMSRLQAAGVLTLTREGADYLAAVPNWPKLQGFSCRNRGEESRGEEKERGPAASPPRDPTESPPGSQPNHTRDPKPPEGETVRRSTVHAEDCTHDPPPDLEEKPPIVSAKSPTPKPPRSSP